MTSPTTGLAQPRFSSLVIIRGSAASDDEVPSTIRISSLMYRRNCQRLKTREAGDQSQDDEDEEKTGDVDARHQLAQRDERADPVLADGERHRAEGADRGDAHDDPDHVEEHVRELIDEIDQRSSLCPEPRQRQAEQDREEQHLEDLAAGERAHDRVGDDVQEEIDRRERFRARGVAGDVLRIERAARRR